jgi:hypothetical protein
VHLPRLFLDGQQGRDPRRAAKELCSKLLRGGACGGLGSRRRLHLRHAARGEGGRAARGRRAQARLGRAGRRRAFQRALAVPSPALEALWRAYEQFESGFAPGPARVLGRRLLDEARPRYQAARGALRERQARLAALAPGALPLPPGARRARGGGGGCCGNMAQPGPWDVPGGASESSCVTSWVTAWCMRGQGPIYCRRQAPQLQLLAAGAAHRACMSFMCLPMQNRNSAM